VKQRPRLLIAGVIAGAAALLVATNVLPQSDPSNDPNRDHLFPLSNSHGPAYADAADRETRVKIYEIYDRLFVVYSNVAEVAYHGSNRVNNNEWVASIHATLISHGTGASIRWEPTDYLVTCTLLDPGMLSAEKPARAPNGAFKFAFDETKLKAIEVIRHDAPIRDDAAEAVRSAWLEALTRTDYRLLFPYEWVLDGYSLTFTASDRSGFPRMSGGASSPATPAMKMLEAVARRLYAYCSVPEGDRNAAAEEIRREANEAAAIIRQRDPVTP
jgi:hypothetical protein